MRNIRKLKKNTKKQKILIQLNNSKNEYSKNICEKIPKNVLIINTYTTLQIRSQYSNDGFNCHSDGFIYYIFISLR